MEDIEDWPYNMHDFCFHHESHMSLWQLAAWANISGTSVQSVYPQKGQEVYQQLDNKLITFMNSQLRKACFKKAMMFNKYKQCQTATNWEHYHMQHNLVTKFKCQSIRNYLKKNVVQGGQSPRISGQLLSHFCQTRVY